MSFTHSVATNNYGPAALIVATSAANGTHTTLATAMAAASVGDTIFLRDSVTENVTITPGVNIAAWTGGSLNTPAITGTLTMTGAGTSNISGIKLVTNSAALIAVTGSAASILNVNDCYLNFSNSSGITYSSSSGSSQIFITNCKGDIGTTGITPFVMTSAGSLKIYSSEILNSGGSSTVSTASAGTVEIRKCRILFPITTSSTNTIITDYTILNTGALNVTALTVAGSGGNSSRHCFFSTGSATSVIINTNTLAMILCELNTNNTVAASGTGTLSYCALALTPGSPNITVTTQAVFDMGPSMTVGSTNSGSNNRLLVTNLSNTATSTADIFAQVGGGTAGDPTFSASVNGVTQWLWGIDNSDSDSYVLAQGGTLGTNNVMHALTTGEINFPLQSAFLARKTTNTADQTGAGTAYTFVASAEIFDQNSDFDGTSTYTCPVTSRVFLFGDVFVTGLTAAMTIAKVDIVTSNRTYTGYNGAAFTAATPGTSLGLNVVAFADMDAADTSTLVLTVSNGVGDTADINGASIPLAFGGYIAC